jgi:uncharacterized membrane protein YphA (DoxX/SURF4 family)
MGLIFIYAGIGKIISPLDFAQLIDNYRILPTFFVKPLAVTLPWIELICGLSLISGYLAKGGMLLIDFLMIIFIIAFTANLFRGIDIACGCFSLTLMTHRGTYFYLARDLLILAVGLWLLIYANLNSSRAGNSAG